MRIQYLQCSNDLDRKKHHAVTNCMNFILYNFIVVATKTKNQMQTGAGCGMGPTRNVSKNSNNELLRGGGAALGAHVGVSLAEAHPRHVLVRRGQLASLGPRRGRRLGEGEGQVGLRAGHEQDGRAKEQGTVWTERWRWRTSPVRHTSSGSGDSSRVETQRPEQGWTRRPRRPEDRRIAGIW